MWRPLPLYINVQKIRRNKHQIIRKTINHESTVCLMIDGSMDNGLMVYEFMKRLQNIKMIKCTFGLRHSIAIVLFEPMAHHHHLWWPDLHAVHAHIHKDTQRAPEGHKEQMLGVKAWTNNTNRLSKLRTPKFQISNEKMLRHCGGNWHQQNNKR